jgi:hypothetical protein
MHEVLHTSYLSLSLSVSKMDGRVVSLEEALMNTSLCSHACGDDSIFHEVTTKQASILSS